MNSEHVRIIEALIFATEEPITSSEITKIIKAVEGENTEIIEKEVEEAVKELNFRYDEEDHIYQIMSISGGYLIATRPEYAKYLGFLVAEKSKRKLSQAALETLSIIAYKQPITKPEIEAIRGVNSDYIINTLLEKNLILIGGRAETAGRPLLYRTTDDFLKYFGLNKISDLPKPREIEELMKDEDLLEQKRRLLMQAVEESVELEFNLDNERSDKNK